MKKKILSGYSDRVESNVALCVNLKLFLLFAWPIFECFWGMAMTNVALGDSARLGIGLDQLGQARPSSAGLGSARFHLGLPHLASAWLGWAWLGFVQLGSAQLGLARLDWACLG